MSVTRMRSLGRGEDSTGHSVARSPTARKAAAGRRPTHIRGPLGGFLTSCRVESTMRAASERGYYDAVALTDCVYIAARQGGSGLV